MDILRLTLFVGLIFHKLLWEVLKRSDRVAGVPRELSKWPGIWFVKLLKAVVLVFLAVQTLFLDLFPITSQSGPLRTIGTAIYFVGLATAVVGRLRLGKNWVDLEEHQVLPEQSLVTHGIYRYIRHPIYAGDLLLIVGLELALNSWLVLGVFMLIPVVIRQALAEEVQLSQTFPGYTAYCRRTKRFIPFVF